MKRIYVLILFISSLLFGSSEYKVKAVYVYNIAKFVQWQNDSFKTKNCNFNIAILGHDDFGNDIDILEGKKVLTHPIVVTKIKRLDNIEKFQIIYISKSEMGKLSYIKKKLDKKRVLLISDMKDFALKGGHVEIQNVGKKLKMVINNHSALRNDIHFSSKILKLATIVETE